MRHLEEITIWVREGIHTKLLDGTFRRDNNLMEKIITSNFSMRFFQRDAHLKEKIEFTLNFSTRQYEEITI